MKQATLGFLIKRDENGKISEILLAMKKRGFGKGRINGTGGKVVSGEKIKDCVIRETQEEIAVTMIQPKKFGLIKFRFKYNENFNQDVHFYMCERWEGEPAESEEMKPRWYKIENIPYQKMWPDDKFWMPLFLRDKKITGKILFGENDLILENSIKSTD
ncbi:MAG: 8-oxo-dGTP diphosphatase [candidate division WS2 bacterium ADurb.Bin280]|uniref:Oxidized purine nucleoside triphosphate hydrolase n=1 Tax=candidate division WS2 bacterium ADurb.Bin280 TaxID=1852829 RepID=A0A1V5SF05_9BACT|nr:MAG: 8-oxo-dGTP diphosphatase [candidate division WS2 bacterium ADurb.Bin280]